MKKFCQKCGARIKGRTRQTLCERCLISEYNRLKKNEKEKKEEKIILIKK